MISVLLPSTLRVNDSNRLEIHDTVNTVAELVDAIDRRIPGFREQLDDSVFNFAVNDEMLLYHAREHALRDGDVVEVIPTISGGSGPASAAPLNEGYGDEHHGEQQGDQRLRIARDIKVEIHRIFPPF